MPPSCNARRLARLGACTSAVVLLLAVRGSGSGALDPDLVRLLRVEIGFSEGDLRDLGQGRAIARLADASAPSEIAVVGAVTVDAAPSRLVAEFRRPDIQHLAPGVLALGAFGSPPSQADLARLSFEPDTLDALRACRPGSCVMKLPADVMGRLRGGIDWSRPDAREQASGRLRDWLVELIAAYRDRGAAALGRLEDQAEPVEVAAELEAILDAEPLLPHAGSDVRAYLGRYPQLRRTDFEDVFYWAKVEFGLKPTVRVNHVTLHPVETGWAGLSYVITTKQLYASHYIRAALELRMLFERPGGFVLIVAARSRQDGMTGLFRWAVRSAARRRARDGLARYLQNVKVSLEDGRPGGLVGEAAASAQTSSVRVAR